MSASTASVTPAASEGSPAASAGSPVASAGRQSALSAYRQSATPQQRNTPLHNRIVEADELVVAGRFEESLLPLAKAIFLASDESVLYIARAEVYLALCDTCSAILNYKKAVKIEWGDQIRDTPGVALSVSALKLAELHGAQARHYLSGGRFEEAGAEAQCAVDLRPLHAPFRVLLVLALVGAQSHEPAMEQLRLLIEADPRNPEFYLLRCRVNLRANKLEEAVDDVARLTRMAPEHPQVLKLTAELAAWCEQLGNKAQDCMNAEQFEQALALLGRAVNLCPDSAQLYHRRGVVHRLAGNLEDAMQQFEMAIERSGGPTLAPDSARQLRLLHNELGVQYHGWGMYVEAIDKFDAAIRGIEGNCELDDAIAKVYANRADCYQVLGVDDKALQDYEMCYSLLKDSSDKQTKAKVASKCALSCFKRGQLAVHFGEFGRAVSFFSKAISLDPGAPEYHFQRAVVSGRLELHKQQRQDLESTLRLDHNHAGAMRVLERICPHHPLILRRSIS